MFLAYGCFVFYSIAYEKGFMVFAKMDEFKRTAILVARCGTNFGAEGAREFEIFRRQMKSVQNEGIRVGSFHVIERISTPTFAEFTLVKVMNLILTFGVG